MTFPTIKSWEHCRPLKSWKFDLREMRQSGKFVICQINYEGYLRLVELNET